MWGGSFAFVAHFYLGTLSSLSTERNFLPAAYARLRTDRDVLVSPHAQSVRTGVREPLPVPLLVPASPA